MWSASFLTSFGTFFAGEGIGVQWWRDDLSLLPLIAAYGLASIVAVWILRHPEAVGLEIRVPALGARSSK